MITVRKSNKRGKTVNDWLTSYHSFSFNHYYDPAYVNFAEQDSEIVLFDVAL